MLTDLTGFQRDLLTIVAAEGPSTGLQIKETVEEEFVDKEVHHGRLYPNLDTLVDYGYVEKQQLDRRTNEYVMTERGKEAIRERVRWEVDNYDFLIDE